MANHEGMGRKLERREILRLAAATMASLVAARVAGATVDQPGVKPTGQTTMPLRNLGKTGFRVGLFSLGGQAALERSHNEKIALPILERALDLGVNYIDTSARYGGGMRWSERYIGEVMVKRRSEAFLATKTHDRSRDGSLRLLEESLKLLRTDHVDLWQLHALSSMGDVDQVFAKGGAMEAFQRAKEQKLVRFLGITGHTDPDVLAEAIRRFPFDTVLMAFNAADPHHLPFQKSLLPLAVEKGMGVIGMKVPAHGRLLSSDSQQGLTMREAMGYVLSKSVSTIIVGVDSLAQLEENVALARSFAPLGHGQLAALERRAEPLARKVLWFRRW